MLEGELERDELLLWAMSREPATFGYRYSWLSFLGAAAAFGFIVFELVFKGTLGSSMRGPLTTGAASLPSYVYLELGSIPVLVAFLLWYVCNVDVCSGYAVTNKRLLVAFGSNRENIRFVWLTELGPVRIYTPGRGMYSGIELLYFHRQGGEPYAATWKFLVNEKTSRSACSWMVPDPESIQQLIERAHIASAHPR